jgi:hypothetical protein
MAKCECLPTMEGSGDASFRSLLTPHSAWTIVRAVSYLVLNVKMLS